MATQESCSFLTCLITPTGGWSRPSADGTELFNIAKVPITRYRYRSIKIPNPWLTSNHA
jgi:RNA-directed DNA polymerase